MNSIYSCVLSVVAASVIAMPAIADEVWSQPAGAAFLGDLGDGFGAHSDTGRVDRWADNFTLTVNTQLTSVKWWGVNQLVNPDPFFDVAGFRIEIYTDNGSGFPVSTPFYSESIPNSSIYAELDPSALINYWFYKTDLPNTPNLVAGSYHLAIVALDAGGSIQNWTWQAFKDGYGTGNSDGVMSRIWDDGDLPETWAFDLAFILNSDLQQAEPPVITCTDTLVLWEPNHDLVNMGDFFTVTDADTPIDDVVISITIVSDESEVPETGDGTGRHAPDFKTLLADGTVGLFVRSERRGRSDGRIYLAVITANDGVNEVTQVCVAAVAPHDQTDESLALVLAEAATRAAALQAAINSAGVGGSVDLSLLGLIEHGVSAELGPKQ